MSIHLRILPLVTGYSSAASAAAAAPGGAAKVARPRCEAFQICRPHVQPESERQQNAPAILSGAIQAGDVFSFRNDSGSIAGSAARDYCAVSARGAAV